VLERERGAMIRSISRKIEQMAKEQGFTDFKWMKPRDVVTGNWVRMKCQFGCDGYAKGGCCPPEVPSVAECRDFFDEYNVGLLFHCVVKFADPELRRGWSRATEKKAVALERQVFLADYPKAFVFPPGGPCRICVSCSASRRECKNAYAARPSLEAFAVDVYATARRMHYPIHVLKGHGEEMNRFGLLLVE
jgi:predicted metal-binding protein